MSEKLKCTHLIQSSCNAGAFHDSTQTSSCGKPHCLINITWCKLVVTTETLTCQKQAVWLFSSGFRSATRFFLLLHHAIWTCSALDLYLDDAMHQKDSGMVRSLCAVTDWSVPLKNSKREVVSVLVFTGGTNTSNSIQCASLHISRSNHSGESGFDKTTASTRRVRADCRMKLKMSY